MTGSGNILMWVSNVLCACEEEPTRKLWSTSHARSTTCQAGVGDGSLSMYSPLMLLKQIMRSSQPEKDLEGCCSLAEISESR